MSEQSIIVWDLETVPDLAAAARMLDMGNASDAEVREALGSGFPKHPLHKIACIGALVASRQPEGWRVAALQLGAMAAAHVQNTINTTAAVPRGGHAALTCEVYQGTGTLAARTMEYDRP